MSAMGTSMDKKNIHVCMVSPLPPPYGGISHWTSMVVNYAASNSDVSISVIDISPRWREVHDLGRLKRALGGLGQLVRDALRLLLHLLMRRPHLVHLTTPGGLAIVRDIVMLAMSRVLRVPAVYHIRFGRVPSLMATHSGMEFFCFRLACGLASRVVAIDASTYNCLVEAGYKNKVQLIPNCYDKAGLPDAADVASKIILYIGWVIPTKGIAELLDAWNMLPKKDDWRLFLVGPVDAKYQEELEQGVSGSAVFFMGGRAHDEAMRMLAQAEVLVLPSHSEGFPNVVLEGMALGKPVLATAVGAIPEMLSEESGVIVPPKDVPALAEKLHYLMNDPDVRRQLGDRAKARAIEHYSLDSVFLSYRKLWQSLSKK